jgi:exosortase
MVARADGLALDAPAGTETSAASLQRWLPLAATALAFAVLFASPARTLARDLWTNPDAGHGLLLIPIAGWIGWKRGLSAKASAQPILGMVILAGAVLLRYVSGLAAELFTMRFSMVMALLGLIIFYKGMRQIVHWWLPVTLVLLSIPLPVVVMSSLALPLQFQASIMGAALLEWRNVPVLLNGNVLQIPGQTLFVTEACSGLRSLTALLSLGVLIGGLWLRYPLTRVLLIALALPVAVLLNGVRVFLTGFLVFFVDPALGEGFMHLTEGWIIFVVAFGILGVCAWLLVYGEDFYARKRGHDEPA